VRIDLRWGGGDSNRIGALAQGRPATRHHPIKRDRGYRRRPAGDGDDPDRLCERERPRRAAHRR
jgi:hypothetical protein